MSRVKWADHPEDLPWPVVESMADKLAAYLWGAESVPVVPQPGGYSVFSGGSALWWPDEVVDITPDRRRRREIERRRKRIAARKV